MRVDEVRYAKTYLFPRLFAVELGITDFKRDLSDAEVALLLCAEHLDSHGVAVADIAGLLRWIGAHIAKVVLTGAKPCLITLLDYRYAVCSVIGDTGYWIGHDVVPLAEVSAQGPWTVSTAFSVSGVYARWQRATQAAAQRASNDARAAMTRAAASAPPSTLLP